VGIVCNSLLCVARSQYHLFNHCHHYTAKGLREAGLPISMLGALTRDGFAKQLRRIMPERVNDIETHGQRLSVSLCPGRNVDNERQDRMFSDPVRSKPLERGPDSRLDRLFVSGCSICDNVDRAKGPPSDHSNDTSRGSIASYHNIKCVLLSIALSILRASFFAEIYVGARGLSCKSGETWMYDSCIDT
jgi:hypothetical protein